jgi:hypothetical protein
VEHTLECKREAHYVFLFSSSQKYLFNLMVDHISMSSKNECFFKNEAFCNETFITFHELRHENFCSTVFPGARSCIEIMLLRSDLFYQTALRLRKVGVCTKHKEDLLREYRRSTYRTCFVCVPCFGKSKSNIAVQNIAAPIALTLYEQLQFHHSYGKLICRRCREEVTKRIDSVRYVFLHLIFLIIYSSNRLEFMNINLLSVG